MSATADSSWVTVTRTGAAQLIADLDAHFAAFDDEQLVGFLALAENRGAGLEEPGFDIVAGQYPKVRVLLHLGPVSLSSPMLWGGTIMGNWQPGDKPNRFRLIILANSGPAGAARPDISRCLQLVLL